MGAPTPALGSPLHLAVVNLRNELRATNTRMDSLERVNNAQNLKLDDTNAKVDVATGKLDILLKVISPSAVREIVKTEIKASESENARTDDRAKVAHRRDLSKTALAAILGGISSVVVALIGAGFIIAGRC